MLALSASAVILNTYTQTRAINMIHGLEKQTANEKASEYDYYVNGLNVTHYITNDLPLPDGLSLRFFELKKVKR